jgi:lactate dehydrogenase-like 2-hydroxyacid dehydrogenase
MKELIGCESISGLDYDGCHDPYSHSMTSVMEVQAPSSGLRSPSEPADGPLLAHPHVVATAHTASLTSEFFAAASRRLGDPLARYLNHQAPAGLLR